LDLIKKLKLRDYTRTEIEKAMKNSKESKERNTHDKETNENRNPQ